MGGPDTITWLEVGGDTDAFALDLNGSLKFNLPSDYETKTSYQTLSEQVMVAEVLMTLILLSM